MNRYERLCAILDADDNKHGPNKAKVNLGAIGGGGLSNGYSRYVTLSRVEPGDSVEVSIYDNIVARVHPDGSATIWSAGHITQSTKAALAFAVNGHATCHTPGSRGGEPGPWWIAVTTDHKTYLVDKFESTFIPSATRESLLAELVDA